MRSNAGLHDRRELILLSVLDVVYDIIDLILGTINEAAKLVFGVADPTIVVHLRHLRADLLLGFPEQTSQPISQPRHSALPRVMAITNYAQYNATRILISGEIRDGIEDSNVMCFNWPTAMGQEEVAMTSKTMRTHIVIDRDLIEEVDRLVGPRHRSEFIAEAIEKKLEQERLRKAAHKAAGALADVDIPGWETHESAVEWVRSLRRENDERMRRDWER